MESNNKTLKIATKAGLKKGLSGFVWMMKILVPISFFTLLLDYSGLITRMDFILAPVMGTLSLPPVAALPLIVGLFTGIYGAVAAMMVLSLTPEEMTLIAIFLLISHNLIQEGIIQGQSGINPVKATLFRLATSVITVMISARFLNPHPAATTAASIAGGAGKAFMPLFTSWLTETAYLSVKIFAIIMTIMVALQIMKALNVIPHIIRRMHPLLRFMGLDRQVGLLWLTASLFGIAYGAAVIVEEVKENRFSEEELTRLHLSIGINHAIIEDPALFLPLGLNAFWLWIPRLMAAIVAVQLLNLWHKTRPRFQKMLANRAPLVP